MKVTAEDIGAELLLKLMSFMEQALESDVRVNNVEVEDFIHYTNRCKSILASFQFIANPEKPLSKPISFHMTLGQLRTEKYIFIKKKYICMLIEESPNLPKLTSDVLYDEMVSIDALMKLSDVELEGVIKEQVCVGINVAVMDWANRYKQLAQGNIRASQ